MRCRQEEDEGEVEEEEGGEVEGLAMSLLLVLWRGPVEKKRHVLLVLAVLASSLRVAAATASVADEERARREPQAKEGVRKARCCCREAFEAMANDEECEIEANKSCTKGVRLLIQLCVVCVNG